MLRVGLTGGIGSGKSTVSARLRPLGAFVVDADAVAREVVEPGTPALAAVVERFGPAVVTADGSLDRPALGRLVFGDRGGPGRPRGDHAPSDLGPHRRARRGGQARRRRRPRHAAHRREGDGRAVPPRRRRGGRGGGAAATRSSSCGGCRRRTPVPGSRRRPTDEERRAAADVWLDNEATPDALRAAVMRLWSERLEPFEAQRAARHPVPPLPSDDVRARPHLARAGRAAARPGAARRG